MSGNLALIRRGISKRVALSLARNEFGSEFLCGLTLTAVSPSPVFLIS